MALLLNTNPGVWVELEEYDFNYSVLYFSMTRQVQVQ